MPVGEDAWLFDLVAEDGQRRDAARARHRTLVDDARVEHSLYARIGDATFATLFLAWEARYPEEWRDPGTWWGSPWTAKVGVLSRFGEAGVPPELDIELTELVAAAVARRYRCKDWLYARVVRHLPGPLLDLALAPLADAPDPLTRLRVRFLLDVARDPERRVSRRTWGQWLGREPAA
ncbi:hypothetical protein [Phytohabitans kaempferiae]|uniref:Uncharacterized protein n=1 Tax=Phytohabitans kaempferiae TaxID=1620943 RepID=A0ABV6MBS7_9ACTN